MEVLISVSTKDPYQIKGLVHDVEKLFLDGFSVQTKYVCNSVGGIIEMSSVIGTQQGAELALMDDDLSALNPTLERLIYGTDWGNSKQSNFAGYIVAPKTNGRANIGIFQFDHSVGGLQWYANSLEGFNSLLVDIDDQAKNGNPVLGRDLPLHYAKSVAGTYSNISSLVWNEFSDAEKQAIGDTADSFGYLLNALSQVSPSQLIPIEANTDKGEFEFIQLSSRLGGNHSVIAVLDSQFNETYQYLASIHTIYDVARSIRNEHQRLAA